MIEFKHIQKKYNSKIVFQDLSLKIQHKEFICLIGNSGSGKSTLFHLLIGQEKPDNGDIFIDGVSIPNLNTSHLQFYRRKVGVVFQDFKLLPKKNVFENLSFILEVCNEPKENIFSKVKKALTIVGLEEKIGHQISELSGGEIQRVAIARALIHQPKIILADEPTGNLDPENTQGILQILQKINKEMGVTIILATHDPEVIKYLHTRVVALKNGGIILDKVTNQYS